ncbi:MAG: hypothetical protein LBR34_03030 [Prevotella sp.]|nr:hypothetical protein [Prevotella sp.]
MLLLSCIPCSALAVGNVGLQNGDLLFQEGCSGDVSDAIKGVTSSVDGYHFTHVGIVWINRSDTFVIEAIRPRVAVTPLRAYLHPDGEACPPLSVAARLKEPFRRLIPRAIEEALRLVGKEYDDAFVLNNDKYYCSELVYEIFLRANDGKPVFQLNTMTFKAKGSDGFMPEWVEYYAKLGLPVPEGESGINPGAMSRSEAVEIVGKP